MIKANITEYDNFSKRTKIDTDNEHIKKQGNVIKGFLEELKNR